MPPLWHFQPRPRSSPQTSLHHHAQPRAAARRSCAAGAGDPALLKPQLAGYSLILAPGPSKHEAGVALLLSSKLLPAVRTYLTLLHGPTCRRSAGAGQRPTAAAGLRLHAQWSYHASPDSPQAQLAREVYAELQRWSTGVQRVLLGGDLNETISVHDRWPQQPRALHRVGHRPIDALAAHPDYIDVFRAHHPDASVEPGYTNHTYVRGTDTARSRIDYIFAGGFEPRDVHSVDIDTVLQLVNLSNHFMLWCSIRVAGAAQLREQPLPEPLPPRANLQAATQKQQEAFARALQLYINAELLSTDLASVESTSNPAALSTFAEQLVMVVRSAAEQTLPMLGQQPLQSKAARGLERQRQQLTQLHHQAEQLRKKGIARRSCPAWCSLLRSCIRLYAPQWSVHPLAEEHTEQWLRETHDMITAARSDIRREKRSMLRASTASSGPQLDRSSGSVAAATVRRMLQSNALPSEIHSVIRPDGSLTATAEELKEEMALHFERVFDLPAELRPAHGIADPRPPPAMLYDKPNIDSDWYGPLMQPITGEELLQSLQEVPLDEPR